MIEARSPGYMVHVGVKKVGQIPDGGAWRVHSRGSAQANAVASATKTGTHAGFVYLHVAVDEFSRLAYTKALDDENALLWAEPVLLVGRLIGCGC